MEADSEMNIAHEWASVTKAMRQRLWRLHTNGQRDQDDPGEAFDVWGEMLNDNIDLQINKQEPGASLIKFFYNKPTLKDQD